MRTIKDVIKAIPQLQNQDYNKGRMGQYGEGEYYEFDDGSIVMEENELEIYHCATTQEWFWYDFNNNLEEEWVYDTIDEGSSWVRSDYPTFLEDLFRFEIGEYRTYRTVYEGSIEDGVEESFGASSFQASSRLPFVDDIEFDFAESVFGDCYSKSEKVFVMIEVANEEAAIVEIAYGLGMPEMDEDIIFAIEENADQLMSAPKVGDNLSKEQIQKLLTLVESGNVSSLIQGIELAVTLDAPNAIDAVIKSLNVDKVVKYLPRARNAISEIDPNCWNGTYTSGSISLAEGIIDSIGDYIDEENPTQWFLLLWAKIW